MTEITELFMKIYSIAHFIIFYINDGGFFLFYQDFFQYEAP